MGSHKLEIRSRPSGKTTLTAPQSRLNTKGYYCKHFCLAVSAEVLMQFVLILINSAPCCFLCITNLFHSFKSCCMNLFVVYFIGLFLC